MHIALKGATAIIPDNLECGGAASSSDSGAPHKSFSLTISATWENKLHPENNQDFVKCSSPFLRCALENNLFRGRPVKSLFLKNTPASVAV